MLVSCSSERPAVPKGGYARRLREAWLLIVTCTRCATHFQLDEGRLPLKGARVRCSRCQESFFLAHPGANHTASVHDSALQALSERVPRQTVESGNSASGDKRVPLVDEDLSDSSPESEEELDWAFDFEAGECSGSDRSTVLDQEKEMDSASLESRPKPKPRGEQSVFASADDIADWLADRSDVMELDPDPTVKETRKSKEAHASPTVREDTPSVSLGVLGGSSNSTKVSPPCPGQEGGLGANESPKRGVLNSDQKTVPFQGLPLNAKEAPVPSWSPGFRAAGHVLGWGITVTLVALGLFGGLRPVFVATQNAVILESSGVPSDSDSALTRKLETRP